MDIKKLLWPNDLSECSERALPFVKSLAKKYDAEVHVLYVLQDLTKRGAWYGDFGPSRIKKLQQWEEETARKRQTELCKKHFEDCDKFSKHIRIGDPAQEILDVIEEENMDMVVICRKGEKENKRFKMGGVAEKIVRNAPVSVVTVPQADEIG